MERADKMPSLRFCFIGFTCTIVGLDARGGLGSGMGRLVTGVPPCQIHTA